MLFREERGLGTSGGPGGVVCSLLGLGAKATNWTELIKQLIKLSACVLKAPLGHPGCRWNLLRAC